ncbi:MAG TPA: hypothetical protein EYP85_06760 [Armatimonadetes bacterium]|nr:hypothetical protein [Armatimonadota bacterium]
MSPPSVNASKQANSNGLWPLGEALLQAGPEVLEILQFGASVYAPDLALDADLLVVSTAKKDDRVGPLAERGEQFVCDLEAAGSAADLAYP